ncbi:phosphoribosyl-AMP cyclohydrolase [Methanosarcina sp. UBA5]|uniref:phosphoribosyl-AMP cyclohydrolase n=1 Tax=Methanosarcina sp. UBA5 TaxID=1915593 RepID=UPI0025D08C78|nr:phosphoribosyl-AMP cyclohydrolase [Methanosarcina sp. UBA5]
MIDFDTLKSEKGLILAVIQDQVSREVLMCAYMNREALEKTVETGIAHFWSRSRQQLWKKGETSGHIQKVKEIRVDCDMDSLLLLVEQVGGACHMGYRSCFYRNLEGEVVGEKVFEPDDVY